MALTIVYRDGRTEKVPNIAQFDISSGHLIMKNEKGEVVGERDDVASAGQAQVAKEGEPPG